MLQKLHSTEFPSMTYDNSLKSDDVLQSYRAQVGDQWHPLVLTSNITCKLTKFFSWKVIHAAQMEYKMACPERHM